LKRRFSLLAALLLLLATFAGAQAANPDGESIVGGSAADPIVHPPLHWRTLPNASTPTGYSPTQIRHAYGIDQLAATGSGQIIAIVDAYDAATVASDLGTFNSYYQLTPMNGTPGRPSCTVAAGPHPCFQKVYQTGTKPLPNASWALEVSLDVEWSHAIAPQADVLLVEANGASTSNLLKSVDVAVKDGARVVSMSWGGSETSTETGQDAHFNHSGVAFVSSSGDSGHGAFYPAASPDLIAVGGTNLPLDANGNLTGAETVWETSTTEGSSGGISADEPEPGYQSNLPIPSIANGKRGIPDVSWDADPATGVAVYDSTAYQGTKGWWTLGGTSVGAPSFSGVLALVDQTRTSGPLSTNNLTSSPVYNAAAGSLYATNFRDITSGSNGTCGAVCNATTGYDFVTGLGSPVANNLVPYLASN
jgi:subtilase family serine protease